MMTINNSQKTVFAVESLVVVERTAPPLVTKTTKTDGIKCQLMKRKLTFNSSGLRQDVTTIN